MGRLAVALVLVLVLTAAGTGAFVALRPGGGGEEAAAGPRRELKPFWYVPIVEEELRRPRADLVVNGIHVGPNSGRRGGPCAVHGNPVYVGPEEVAGSELDISPSYLPPGTKFLEMEAVACGGQLSTVVSRYWVEPDPVSMRFGGNLRFVRYRGEHYAELYVAADRVEAGTVKGRPAVFVRPLTDDGFGESFVIVAEDFGITFIEGNGITFDELLRVAESLYK